MAKAKDTGPVIRTWYITDNPDPVAIAAMRDQLHWELTEIKTPEEYGQAVATLKSPDTKKPEVILIGEKERMPILRHKILLHA